MSEHPQIIRKGFGLKEKIRPQLEASYRSLLIDQIRAQGFELQSGDLTIYLAEQFGFCYGVDRAIELAYETKARFPDRRIYLTDEIIHNPHVNAKLQEMGIQFLKGPYAPAGIFAALRPEDVVIIPAFGTPARELEDLERKGCVLVDTTCGSVMSVWKRVESYSRDGFTAVIHGKYDHQETLATCSRARKFMIVRDKKEAAKVCAMIEGRFDRGQFLSDFEKAVSQGFDPDQDLGYLGCANQTTMLSSESLEIAGMLRSALGNRYGAGQLPGRFRHFDTICSATQDRQDAVLRLVQKGIHLMIIVGGYNSSNTAHLVDISRAFCPAYHVEDARCILSSQHIRHKKSLNAGVTETEGWLPPGPLKIGVTAGASTPNRVIEEVIKRILEIKGLGMDPSHE